MAYVFTDDQLEEIKKARKENRDKRIEKRLEALQLRAEGKKNKEISDKTGFHIQYITVLVSRYKKEGINGIIANNYRGNHRNLSYAEEEALLEPFRKDAEAGKMVSIKDIEAKYIEAVGHTIGTSQIYYVLHRHNWRKIMPRSKHPKKASEEAIAASKKLTTV